MSITITQGHLIRASKQAGNTVFETARRFGIPIPTVKWIYDGNEPKGGYRVSTPKDMDFEDNGRIDIRSFMIARKAPDGAWPDTPEVRAAQRMYDHGLIEMAQGRSSKYIFLYSFPRKVRVTRRQTYFGY